MEKEIFRDHWERGVYNCRKCLLPVFRSGDKFNSGLLRPSFRKPVPGAVKLETAIFPGFTREQVLCAGCGSHLGNLFHDGKLLGDRHKDAGERYCIESAKITFSAAEKKAKPGKGRARKPARKSRAQSRPKKPAKKARR
ncbi:MAG TPA: peptide-methionine (R)-S-oxide reductase [Candidatus Bilamarchaeum sp.]|nr:peptide-methionine (R)-S-oxide reductase [Candidatus Bilamarchaeum sp.]